MTLSLYGRELYFVKFNLAARFRESGRGSYAGEKPSEKGADDSFADASLGDVRASVMTFSRTAMYSRKRRLPASVMRISVCGRLLWKPFHTCTRPASCKICTCRLRLPSVSAHRSFK